MGKFSRDKGIRGEQELASRLRELGISGAYRSCQYCGSASSADLLGIPSIHAEVKRCERLSIYSAYEQAKRDTGESEDIPTVFHRKNGKPWLVVLSVEDWVKLYQSYINHYLQPE